MDCHDAKSLIERLADDEASASEAQDAQTHLASCASCRSDRELLEAFARALARPLPEPPEGYFDALPGRILARLDGSSAPGVVSVPFWKRVVTPDALRWEALAAVLIVAVAVGLVATREGLLDPSPRRQPGVDRSTAPVVVDEDEAGEEDLPAEQALPDPVEERSPAPPAAPEASMGAPQPEPPLARDRRQGVELREDAAVAAEEAVGGSAGEAEEREESFAENALKSADAPAASGRASARSAPAAPSLAQSIVPAANDCERWRRALEGRIPESESGREARYRLARCSIERFQAEGTDTLRELAIADAEAFLELEKEGARVDEIRAALSAIR